MVANFVIPLNVASIVIQEVLLIAAAIFVFSLGKAGLRSYIVGFVAFISSYAVRSIAMTIIGFTGLLGAGRILPQIIEVAVTVLLQTAALRFFMHVFLKRNTYAVFYGAGVGFAFGNMIFEVMSNLTYVTIATAITEGRVSADFHEDYASEIVETLRMTLADAVAMMIYPAVIFVVYVAVAVVIGHAVRGEREYLYYAGGGWLAAGLILTLQQTLGAPAWVKMVTYAAYAAVSVYLILWSKKKYGLEAKLFKDGDFHAPLGRHEQKKRK